MATQDSRIKIKRSTVNSTVPTVPSSSDHTDGTWIATDIYKGELFFNQADGIMFSRDDSGIVTVGGKSDSALYSASLTIASADVLQLNSTPLTIVTAQGVGTTIQVIDCSVAIDFNSVAYDTNMDITITQDGADAVIGEVGNDILSATVSTMTSTLNRDNPTSGQTQMIENAALLVQCLAGDPLNGDSDITVYVTYRIITL